ncbi:sulfotransferase family protein [Rhizobium sullae]|uniref:Sulfotransferase family protein n=2 Tax=Rhizobium sullae TaxID=50338 RepID=A0A4R3PX41_RHISU|nr:sulfotransferase family protein [Rhizobium sullae]
MKVPRNLFESLVSNAGLPMIFVHTPKCGGSFVGQAFGQRLTRCPTLRWPEAKGHKTYLEYREIFGKRGMHLSDFVVFTVIRNPWDWHLSWYNYVSKDTNGTKSGMRLEHEQIRNLTFSEYTKWLEDLQQPRSPNDYARRQVSDWIIDENGDVAVHEILRQEALQDELSALKRKYGLYINIPAGKRVNASRQTDDYRKAYTTEDAERIARRHSRDLTLFGYRFE